MNKHIEQLPENVRQLIPANASEVNNEQTNYVPPTIDILTDAVTALALGKNILLKGPTGSGKTKLAETLATIFQQSMYSVNCSVDLDAESLIGFKTLTYENERQAITFVPGPVTNAMEQGTLLYIDEINMAKPETLPLINGVLDYRRTVTNPFTNEVITAASGFNVIAAINEGYIGTVPLNEALKNRFIVIDVPYITGDALREVIEAQTKLTDKTTIDRFIQLSTDLITATTQGKLPEEAASIRALLDACDMSTIIPIERAIQRAIADKLTESRERQLVMNLATTIFG